MYMIQGLSRSQISDMISQNSHECKVYLDPSNLNGNISMTASFLSDHSHVCSSLGTGPKTPKRSFELLAQGKLSGVDLRATKEVLN